MGGVECSSLTKKGTIQRGVIIVCGRDLQGRIWTLGLMGVNVGLGTCHAVLKPDLLDLKSFFSSFYRGRQQRTILNRARGRGPTRPTLQLLASAIINDWQTDRNSQERAVSKWVKRNSKQTQLHWFMYCIYTLQHLVTTRTHSLFLTIFLFFLTRGNELEKKIWPSKMPPKILTYRGTHLQFSLNSNKKLHHTQPNQKETVLSRGKQETEGKHLGVAGNCYIPNGKCKFVT